MNESTADELRALDVRVALEIFSWVWLTPGHTRFLSRPDTPHGKGTDLQIADESMPLGLYGSWYKLVPRYTTDPVAFMALLNILTAKESASISLMPTPAGKAYASIIFWEPGMNKREGSSYGASIMIALVLAALAACEVKSDGCS